MREHVPHPLMLADIFQYLFGVLRKAGKLPPLLEHVFKAIQAMSEKMRPSLRFWRRPYMMEHRERKMM